MTTIILRNDITRANAKAAIDSAPLDYVVEIKEPKRSTEQNSKLWAMLGEISAQVVWHGQKLTSQNWKDVFTAAQKRQQVVPGIDDGFVVLGTSTSRMRKSEMIELIELITAFSVEHDVKFSDPAFAEYEQLAARSA